MFVIIISHFTLLTLYCIYIVMYWINLHCKVKLLLLLFHNFHLYSKTLILFFVFQSSILFTVSWHYPKWTRVTFVWTLITFDLICSSVQIRMFLSWKKKRRDLLRRAFLGLHIKSTKLLLLCKYLLVIGYCSKRGRLNLVFWNIYSQSTMFWNWLFLFYFGRFLT